MKLILLYSIRSIRLCIVISALAILQSNSKVRADEVDVINSQTEIAPLSLDNLNHWLEIRLSDCEACEIAKEYILELETYSPGRNQSDIEKLYNSIEARFEYDEIDFIALSYYNYIISTLNNDYISSKIYEQNINNQIGYLFDEIPPNKKYIPILENLMALSSTLVDSLNSLIDLYGEIGSEDGKSYLLRTIAKICISEGLFYCDSIFDLNQEIKKEIQRNNSDELRILQKLIVLTEITESIYEYPTKYDENIENLYTTIHEIIKKNDNRYFNKYYEYLPDEIFSKNYSNEFKTVLINKNLEIISNHPSIELEYYIYETADLYNSIYSVDESLRAKIRDVIYNYASNRIRNGFSAVNYDKQISTLFPIKDNEFTKIHLDLYSDYKNKSNNFTKNITESASFILNAIQSLLFENPTELEFLLEDLVRIYSSSNVQIFTPASALLLSELIKQTEFNSTIFTTLLLMEENYIERNNDILTSYYEYINAEKISIPMIRDINRINTKIGVANIYIGKIARNEHISLIRDIQQVVENYGRDEIINYGFDSYLYFLNLAVQAAFEKDIELINMIVDTYDILTNEKIIKSSIKTELFEYIESIDKSELDYISEKEVLSYARDLTGSIGYYFKDYIKALSNNCEYMIVIVTMGHSNLEAVRSYISLMDPSEIPELSELQKCSAYEIYGNRLDLLNGLYLLNFENNNSIFNHKMVEINRHYIEQVSLSSDIFVRQKQLPPSIKNGYAQLALYMYYCSVFFEYNEHQMSYFDGYVTNEFLESFLLSKVEENISSCNQNIIPVLDMVSFSDRTSAILSKTVDLTSAIDYIETANSVDYFSNLVRDTSQEKMRVTANKMYAESLLKLNEVTRLVSNGDEIFRLSYSPSWDDLKEFQNRLSNEAVLVIHQSAIYFITESQISSYSFKNNQFNLLLSATSMLLNQSSPRRNMPSYDYELANEIYNVIFGSFEDQLVNIENISVVTDTPLYGLPFNILVTDIKRKSFAYETYDFVVWPSIRSFYASKLSIFNETIEDSFLGIGNPSFSGANRNIRDVNIVSGESTLILTNLLNYFGPLPETEEEINIISSLFSSSDIFVGNNATEERIRDLDFSKYSTVMFSTHGVLSGEIPGLTEPAIVLSPSSISSVNDGLLTASEISDLNFSSSLIILSACNTNIDRSRENYDLNGLSTAFLYAGAKSLLVTNWQVETNSIKDLTTRALQYMRKNNSSLNDGIDFAITELRKDVSYDHPAYWGPLTVIGETFH